MTPENHQVAWTTEEADEFATTGASQDGAEVAERVAEEALDTRKKVYTALSFCGHLP